MKKQSGIEAKIHKKLSEVMDPELFISITDLGFIYDVKYKNRTAYITMTLTSMGCPLFMIIEDDIRKNILLVDNVDKVSIKLVFDPPWSLDKMSDNARAIMGI